MSVLKWKLAALQGKTRERERGLRGDRDDIELLCGDEQDGAEKKEAGALEAAGKQTKRAGLRERLSASQVMRGKEIRRAELRRKKSRKPSDDEEKEDEDDDDGDATNTAAGAEGRRRQATGDAAGGGQRAEAQQTQRELLQQAASARVRRRSSSWTRTGQTRAKATSSPLCTPTRISLTQRVSGEGSEETVSRSRPCSTP